MNFGLKNRVKLLTSYSRQILENIMLQGHSELLVKSMLVVLNGV